MSMKRPPLSFVGIDTYADNRYARCPIAYRVSDGYQEATKTAPNEWTIVGDFHGDDPTFERKVTDAEMLDEWGDETEERDR